MKATLYIQNLKCAGCEATITDQLSELKNISDIVVNHRHRSVTFEHHSGQDIEIVRKLLSKLGYPQQGDINNLGKKAKSYISCAIGRMPKKINQ